MRIAVSGTQGIGKTTVINDFLKTWPQYKLPATNYRDILRERKLPHSRQATKETQEVILNWMYDEARKYRKTDKVIFDRCAIDNLVYSMWAFEKGVSDIDKEFIDKSISIVKEALRYLDILFFIPITRVHRVEYINDDKDMRDTDTHYREEIDNIFKALAFEWQKPISPFVAHDDKPALIEIFGSPEERIQYIKMYLDNDGDDIGEGKLIDPGEIARLSRELGVKPGEDLIKAIRR